MRSDEDVLTRLEIVGEFYLRLKAAAENADPSTPEGLHAIKKYWAANGALSALNWVAYDNPEMEMKLMQLLV